MRPSSSKMVTFASCATGAPELEPSSPTTNTRPSAVTGTACDAISSPESISSPENSLDAISSPEDSQEDSKTPLKEGSHKAVHWSPSPAPVNQNFANHNPMRMEPGTGVQKSNTNSNIDNSEASAHGGQQSENGIGNGVDKTAYLRIISPLVTDLFSDAINVMPVRRGSR
jgi:hypothetical protein